MMKFPDTYHNVSYTCPWCGAPGKHLTKGAPTGVRIRATCFCKICKKLVGVTFEFNPDFVAVLDTYQASVAP